MSTTETTPHVAFMLLMLTVVAISSSEGHWFSGLAVFITLLYHRVLLHFLPSNQTNP